jgi:hypothetical protein
LTDTATARCEYHHRTPAVAACALCGKAVCGVCVRTVNAATLCTGCAVGRETQKAWLAAVFGLLLPGAGQVYNGDIGKAVAVFVLGPLVVPWLWGVYDAAAGAEAIARGERKATTVPTGGVLLALKIVWLPAALLYGAVVVTVLALIVGAVGAALS